MGALSSAPHGLRTSGSPAMRIARIFGSVAVAIDRGVSGRNAVKRTMGALATLLQLRASSGSGARGIIGASEAQRPRPTRCDLGRASADSIGDSNLKVKTLFLPRFLTRTRIGVFSPRGFWHPSCNRKSENSMSHSEPQKAPRLGPPNVSLCDLSAL